MYTLRNKPQAEMTATPSKYPQKVFKDKECRKCGTVFSPQAPSHLYCSQKCADWFIVSRYLTRNYGMNIDDYYVMLEKQKSLCKLCGGEGFCMAGRHVLKLVVDHCHKTGVVRGLLCHNCNRALGLFHDSVDTMKRAITYLEGATTIPQGSTAEAIAAGSAQPL